MASLTGKRFVLPAACACFVILLIAGDALAAHRHKAGTVTIVTSGVPVIAITQSRNAQPSGHCACGRIGHHQGTHQRATYRQPVRFRVPQLLRRPLWQGRRRSIWTRMPRRSQPSTLTIVINIR